jgi:hypothetical protein
MSAIEFTLTDMVAAIIAQPYEFPGNLTQASSWDGHTTALKTSVGRKRSFCAPVGRTLGLISQDVRK